MNDGTVHKLYDAPGCRPNPAQALLLKAACTPANVACDFWKQWRAENELASSGAASVRLLPWIYLRREELGVSAEDASALESLYRFAWMTNQRFTNSALTVLETLEHHHIPVLLLKGLPLLVEAYKDIGGRYMEDFDIMLHEEDVERAVAALAEFGWEPTRTSAFSEPARRWRHSEEVRHVSGPSCDIHWRLLCRPNEPVDEEPLWASCRTILLRDRPVLTLSPEHMLVHGLVHGFSWERIPAIRWILDTHLLLRRHTPNWRHVVAEAARREVTLLVADAIAVYDEILPGEIPAQVRRDLVEQPVSDKQRRAREQLTGPYESASLRMVWDLYLSDWSRACFLKEVPRGLRGFLQHFKIYWRVRSLFAIPLKFLMKILSRAKR